MNNDSEQKKKQKTRVKVAIRVRPMIPRQISNNENACVQFKSNNQIILGSDKQYKFDNVFRDTSHQSQVYDGCVKQLVTSCFEGYNAAILAYGQTGSGKTFTMGTAVNTIGNQNQTGIVPRVINQIFSIANSKKGKVQIRVKSSFLQIYNQQIKDLLSLQHGMKNGKSKDNGISIRQEKDGSVSIYGLTEQQSKTPEQMIALLERGGYNRTTAATLMNDASSRSHAIFTIFIQQHIIQDLYKSQKPASNQETQGYMTAKFFFVDLAGSERAKKTGATGTTLKQGININLGLLQLGNVISALSTIQRKQDQFITYRNSKLTRILQDCLGGNSNTYMIACVSPAQSNFQESLNTLKYASKAMNIKNKPVINRDPQSALISQLKQKIFELQVENRKFKQILSKQGNSLALLQSIEFNSSFISDDHDAQQLMSIKHQLLQLQKKYQQLQQQQTQTKRRTNQLQIKNYDLKRKNDTYQLTIQQIQSQHPEWKMKKFQDQEQDDNSNTNILLKYQEHIQSLQNQLQDKERLFHQLQKQLQKLQKNSKNDQQILINKNKQIYQLSKSISTLQKLIDGNSSVADKKQSNTTNTTNITKSQIIQQLTLQQVVLQTQLQEQFLQNDKQILNQQENIQKAQQCANEQIESIQKYIKQKQLYLQRMTKKQINMQYQLISQMKQQYHQKILLLQKQKKFLVKQKDDTISTNQKGKFVSKIDNLQNQLKQYRKKIKEQKTMEKQLSSQNGQIKDLADQIKKFKLQKLQLNRKLKQDKDNFNKLKNQRIKELLQAKRQSLKKQNLLKKAQLQNQKKTLQFRKKDQQIKRVKRVNQTLKNLIRQPIPSESKAIKKQGVSLSIVNQLKKIGSIQHSPQQELILNQKQICQYISCILNKLTIEIDHEKTQAKYTLKINQLQQQMDNLLNDQSIFKLKLQKIILTNKEQRTDEDVIIAQQYEVNIQDLTERLSNLDDSLMFIRDKQIYILNQQITYFDIDSQLLYNRQLTQYVDNVRIFYKQIVHIIRKMLQDNFTLIELKQQNQSQINQLNLVIQELRQRTIKINQQHQNNLCKLRQQMIMRNYNNSYNQQPQYNPNLLKKVQQKQKKSLQRKFLDLTKSNRQLSQEVEIWKRKCSVVQDKYQNMKNLLSKDKNIGRQQKQQSKQKRNKNQGMLQQVNDILDQFDKIDKMRRINSTSQMENQPKQEKEERIDYRMSSWECMGKIDAHNTPILSMAAHANILISTATKSLKIWDLETSKIISDLSGPHLAGFVKYVMVDPERRLMFTACQKNITIWDLVTLNVEGTLKAHKDQVRTMHIVNDYLFTGGKGLANSGSLLAWDLRNLNPNHPMEQKQRNQDIFSFASKNNILYYGTRNHHVRRMNISNMQILSPFEPPHMDSVTGLAIVKEKLVSGSKDKNLRLWGLDTPINNAKHTFPAFNDYITLCQGDKELPIFYTGSRDGQIKVGGVKNQKIQLIGGIMAHTQSVNAICPLEENNNIIVTASADKTIKLWQPTQQTVTGIQTQFL